MGGERFGWRKEERKTKREMETGSVWWEVMTSSSSYGGSLFSRKCRLGVGLIRTI